MKHTIEQLKAILDYDPETGIFKWKRKALGRVRPSMIAGTKNADGYMIIKYDGKLYRCHRLAWAFMTDEWPEGMLDHKNMIKHDNAWSNLRLATRSQNSQNTTRRADNKSGHKNVFWCETHQKWCVRLKAPDGKYHARYRHSLEEAITLSVSLREKLHGEFARF